MAVAVRAVAVGRAPLVHPDSPAYLDLAGAAVTGDWSRVLGGYYSPLYPLATALLLAIGIDAELGGRLVAALAGVASVGLVFVLARSVVGPTAAGWAAWAAALAPSLVRAGAQVLPETLAGLCLVASALLAAGGRAPGAAGALAGAAYLTRPEGALAVVLEAVWLGHRRLRAGALALTCALAVMAPAVLAIHARTGRWSLSPREGAIAARAGVPGESSLAAAVRAYPGRVAARWAGGSVRQTWNTGVALGPVLGVAFLVGLVGARRRGDALWPLAFVAAFTLGPVALNPSPRYALPTLPFLLPWVGVGIQALVTRIGHSARPVLAVTALGLAVTGWWERHPFDRRCNQEVGALIRARYGEGVPLVAVDGRFAWAARGVPVVPRRTDPGAALALARERRARLWLTRPHWVGRGWVPPPGVTLAGRPCDGVFALYEIAPSE